MTSKPRSSIARTARIHRTPSLQGHAFSVCEPLESRRLLSGHEPFDFFAGRVVVEAEQYDSRTTASGHSWQKVAGGVDGAMKVLPDNGARIDSNIAGTSPRLNYRINFPYAGEYMIFIRGQAVAGNVGESDSLHVGVDGIVQSGVDRFGGFGPGFDWQSETMDQPGTDFETRINVPTAGEHTVNLYMREDGLTIDRFFISGGYGDIYPIGAGPRASERSNVSAGPPQAEFFGSLDSSATSAGPAELRYVQGNVVDARSVVPLPDGRFYLFHRSDMFGIAVTRHYFDGTMDRNYFDPRDEGIRRLSDGDVLATGRIFPQPDQGVAGSVPGGFLVWVAGSSGSPNRIYRYNLELEQDGSYGGGDGFIETDEEFAISPNGGVVEFRHLTSETVRWTRYSPNGVVEFQFDRPAPHIGAIAPNGIAYQGTAGTPLETIEALADGSVIVVLDGYEAGFHGLRKFNSDFTPNTTWAGDGIADLDMYDSDSRHEMIEASPDGRIFVSERDVDGENYMTLLSSNGVETAGDVNYYYNPLGWGFYSIAENQSVRFHSDGDVSIAYTITGDHGANIENWPNGFGVDRFNADGTRDSSFSPIRVNVGNFFDESLRGADTALLADGTFVIAANAGSDALLWRVKPGPVLPLYNESAGFVEIQAEIFTGKAPGIGAAAGHTWNLINTVPSAAEPGLFAAPNRGLNLGDSTSGPRRDYAINFTTTGTYYVWVRMTGTTGSDDSLHVGLDGVLRSFGSQGVALSASERGYYNWVWKERTSGGMRVTVNVTTPGRHTLNLWMREDGVEVDRFILTRDPAFNPANTFREFDGRVDIEAERSTTQAAGTGNAAGHTWSLISDGGASSGFGLQATPNTGLNVGTALNGPRRDYAIQFTTSGTYYGWVRMSGANGSDDSLHVGMEGLSATFGGQGVTLTSGERGAGWVWKQVRSPEGRVGWGILAGETWDFNLWMREDGTKVDKFILTTDDSFVP